jgi:hypothetical protein
MTTQANPADQDGVKTPADNNEGKVDKTPSPSGQDANKTPSGGDDKTQEQMIPMSRFRKCMKCSSLLINDDFS